MLLSGVGAFGFIALLAVLHVLRSDLDPSWRFISEYELGEYGWMMRMAFFSLALSTCSMAIALYSHVQGFAGYIGLLLLMLSGAGMALAGIFIPVIGGRLHDVGALLDQVPFAALFITWGLSRNQQWSVVSKPSWCVALIPLLGFLVFMISMAIMLPRNGGRPGPSVLVGWQNRFMILTQCVWLLYMAWRTLALRPRSQVSEGR